ncbi:MAG: ATP-binding protein [bacterium]
MLKCQTWGLNYFRKIFNLVLTHILYAQKKIVLQAFRRKNNPKISIVIGPRQVGKTTILKQLQQELGGIYLDLDILENAEKFETYKKAIEFLQLEGLKNEKFYLFLDEFQKYENITKVLKNIYDNHTNIKIFATGSSSIQIKGKIQESLAGRKFLHFLYPLDFEEFYEFKGKDLAKLKRIRELKSTTPKPEFQSLLTEFILYGGYPEVVLSKDKQKILGSIFDSYIKKDLVDYLKPDELIGIKKLIQYLAVNNGNKLNLKDISQSLSIQRYRLEQYLEILEETFIVQRITPFFTNKNKEITKAYKEYFMDNGIRNYFLNNFNPLELRNDAGFLFESFVAEEILKNSEYDLNFWQDKLKHEVDFIIDKVHEQIALEAKFKTNLKSGDYRNLNKLPETIRKKYLVNLAFQDNIHILPYSIKNIIK